MSEPMVPGNPEEQKPQSTTLLSLQSSRLAGVSEAFPRNNRTLAIAALSVAVVAGAIVLYVWTDMQQARTANALGQDALSDRIGDLEKISKQRSAELDKAREGNEAAVRQNEEMKSTLDELRTRVTRDRGDWLLAESDFLLNTANRKLNFDRDVASAIAALQEADDRLQMLNDPSLTPVRAAIAKDLQALRSVPAVDRNNLAVQLGTLIQATPTLPLVQGLAAPVANTNANTKRPPVDGVGSFFSALWSDIKGLVTVRRLNQNVAPLLPPEQSFFLRENLTLKLETARAALLQREPTIYQASLTEAQEWLNHYFDVNAPATKDALDAVARLRATEIAPALPDIGDSLRQLHRIKRQLDAEVRGEGER